MTDKVQEDFGYEGASAANDELGSTAEGRKLLSSSLGEIVLGKYEEAEKLGSESIRDPLTGAFNRRYLDNQIDRLIQKRQESFAVLWFDIDLFKTVNDNFGHAAGDAVLKEFCAILDSSLRVGSGDFLARSGGEEFAVVLRGVKNLKLATETAERIRIKVSEYRFRVLQGEVNTTVSGGVGVWNGKENRAELMDRVDAALTIAKKSGRNRIKVSGS
jgi:two-component system cell cycle response regulator